jgi:anaerobic magnesium-protoporphyrin IX monomethyl ester cyclase
MNKTITLIRPPDVIGENTRVNHFNLNISLVYLASVLQKNGYEIKIIDSVGEDLHRITPAHRPGLVYRGISHEEIVNRIPENSGVIGIQLAFTRNYVFTRSLIRIVRARFPESLVVAGGEHVSALPEYTMQDCPEIDICCIGEAEETFPEVCREYFSDRNFEKVRGIYFRQNGKIRGTGRRDGIPDLDKLPWPLWDAIPLDVYLSGNLGFGPDLGRRIPIMASRGCPHQCTFCSSSLMWGNNHRTRSPHRIVEEIQYYVQRYKIDAVEILDLTISTNREWFSEFLHLLQKADLGITWSIPVGTRSEIMDEETLCLMYETGCRYIGFAPESGSERTLSVIKKRLDLEKLAGAIEAASKIGIITKANLIIGFPFETRRDVLATFRFIVKLAFCGTHDAMVNIYIPFPGTEIFNNLIENGTIKPGDGLFDGMGLDWDVLSARRKTVCKGINHVELKFYRFCFSITFRLLSGIYRFFKKAA